MKREIADIVPEGQACCATEALETAETGGPVRYSAVSSDSRASRCCYILLLGQFHSSDASLRLDCCKI
jgi:hypothetical protein